MTKPRRQARRLLFTATALGVAVGLSATVTAGDLSGIGVEAQAVPPSTALTSITPLPDEPVDNNTAGFGIDEAEGGAMYRLPEIDDQPAITPIDGPPSEPWTPPITILPAIEEPAPEAPPADKSSEPVRTTPPPADGEDLSAELDEVWSAGPSAAVRAEIGAPQAALRTAPAQPYAPTTAELSRELLPAVQNGYRLAQHGAVFAAQTEFIQVLRRIAESKDTTESTSIHAEALAAGMRALDEASDFTPHGAQLEAEMDVAVIASAHRTPVLGDEATNIRASEAIARYHQFAREQLALSVAGEQAGSMALYGLGKIHNRLARSADAAVNHERQALVMFQAALDAGPGNHLAANEVGVLLARGGQLAAASAMFRRAIDIQPSSTSYHNLAVVDRKLGYHEQALANEQYAAQLAARDRAAGAASRSRGVQWVAPQELSQVAQPLPMEARQQQMVQQPTTVGQAQTASKWPQKLVPGIFRR